MRTVSVLRIPNSAFRTPYSVFRTPYSAFRTPYSVLRTPYSGPSGPAKLRSSVPFKSEGGRDLLHFEFATPASLGTSPGSDYPGRCPLRRHHRGNRTSSLRAVPRVTLNFEAAVCDGIPIIHSLQTDYLGDNIMRVMGIMNGPPTPCCPRWRTGDPTTGASSLGGCGARPQYFIFAEANSAADVEGLGVRVGGMPINLLYQRS